MIEEVRGLIYYLFKVRGLTLRDEARILAGLAMLFVRRLISLLRFGKPPMGLWSTIPGRGELTVRVDNMVFKARPRTMDLSFATWFIDIEEGYELRNWVLPNARGVFIDVGANVGGYTVRVCRKAELVVAIEPQPEVFEVLRQNVELNCPGNVVLIRKAVADYAGKTILKIPLYRDIGEDSGVASIIPGYEPFPGAGERIEYYRSVEVDVDTLDNILDSLGIEWVDFLKVDVEGAEGSVVNGAKRSLARTSKIMIEVREYNKYVLDILRGFGFEVIDRRGGGVSSNYFLVRRSS